MERVSGALLGGPELVDVHWNGNGRIGKVEDLRLFAKIGEGLDFRGEFLGV